MDQFTEMSDTVHLLSVFPDMVWRKISANVKDISTYRKASASSEFLKNCLSKQHIRILFPCVAQVMYQHFDRHVSPKKAFQLLKSCRAVCRSWKRDVDQILHNLKHHYSFPALKNRNAIPLPIDILFRGDPCGEIVFDLDEPNGVAKFTHHFRSSHLDTDKNPFLLRDLEVRCVNLQNRSWEPEYFALVELLKKCGHHVWYCQIILTEDLDEPTCFEKLKEILILLPNLRVIWIESMVKGELTDEILNRLNGNAELTPMPTLAHVEFIKTSGLIAPLTEQFWMNNPHIKMLEIQQGFRPINVGRVHRIPLPNLEKICMRLLCLEHFQDFESAPVTWPLKKLDLTVGMGWPFNSGVQWERIFRCVEQKFGNTLITLVITLPVRDNRVPFTGRLNLPNLKNLCVQMPEFVNMDFMLPMKSSLEIVIVEGQRLDPQLAEGGIKLHCYDNEMWRSNIWGMFPALKKMKIRRGIGFTQERKCTRSQWREKRINNQNL